MVAGPKVEEPGGGERVAGSVCYVRAHRKPSAVFHPLPLEGQV